MTPTALLKLSSYIKTNPPSIVTISIITISFLISITTSQSTVPTQNETATQDIYYATKDTAGTLDGFQLGTIKCATDKDCIVYCDILSAGCNLATIDARDAKSLYLECNKASTCNNVFNVYGPTAEGSTATIICNQNTACAGPSSYLHLNNTPNANVICTGGGGPDAGACLDLKIFSASDVNNVNVSCGPNDCKGMELWTKPASFNTFLTCDGENSCIDAGITCITDNGKSDLTWNEGNNEWECSDESCCPLIDMSPWIPGGFNASFEIVECSTVDCVNRYIDGSGLTVNMTVNCDTANSCDYAKIICPPSESCIINCGTNACHDILIDATLSSDLFLECDAISACERADIYCSSNERSCFIECGGHETACNDMQIYQENENTDNYFDIKCPPPISSFEDACSNIRFHCSSTTDYATLLWDDVIQKSGGQCTDITADCCPFGTPSPVTASPTTAQPTSDPTTKAPATASDDTSQPTTADGVIGGDPVKKEESSDLIYIIIGGFGVLALCVCFWGGFIWWQKRKNSGYGNEGGRGSKSSRGNNKYGSGNNNNYNNNTNIHDTGSQTNPGAYGGGGVTPMMGHNLSDKPAHLEIEKSMEMPSTTQASITEPTRTHNTITTYNPGRDYKKNGAGATITAYSRNPSNAPPSLGLADLGNNNGW